MGRRGAPYPGSDAATGRDEPGRQSRPGCTAVAQHHSRLRRQSRNRQSQRSRHPHPQDARRRHEAGDHQDRSSRASEAALDQCSPDAMEQVRLRPPPLRHALHLAGEPKAAQGGDRVHAERCGDGGMRRRSKAVPDRTRRVAGCSAARDGAGVDPHRQRGGPVDEPRVGAGRRSADELRRSPRTRDSLPRGDERGEESVRPHSRRLARPVR